MSRDLPRAHRRGAASDGASGFGSDPIREADELARQLNALPDLSTLTAMPGGDTVMLEV
jgi:hypothetical protein